MPVWPAAMHASVLRLSLVLLCDVRTRPQRLLRRMGVLTCVFVCCAHSASVEVRLLSAANSHHVTVRANILCCVIVCRPALAAC